MKQKLHTGMLSILVLFYLPAAAQDTRIDIHQINVGNGDGALIRLIDNKVVVFTMVIDGGLSTNIKKNPFIPYLTQFIPADVNGIRRIDWAILSHYHQDHFNGLIQLFNNEKFIIEEISDPGGYNLGEDNFRLPLEDPKDNNCVTVISRNPKNKKAPQNALLKYVGAVKAADENRFQKEGAHISHDTVFNCSTNTFEWFTLPAVGGIQPIIRFVAANAFTMGITRKVGSLSPNNFSIAWILEYGTFRFYSGGDLGGYPDGYTDQETAVSEYLKTTYPTNTPSTGTQTGKNFPGHVCVMKVNHHGSGQSSNPVFLSTLAPSAIVTSAGLNKGWKIPTIDFLNRVADDGSKFGAVQGIYFTQIYNYTGSNARTKANSLFSGAKAYNYVTPSDDPNLQYSYLFSVQPNGDYIPPPPGKKRKVDITKESLFTVYKVTNKYAKLEQCVFLCHKPS